MSQRVACPGCGVKVSMRHLRYGNTCYVPRGRPRKRAEERESEAWDRAIAALTRRLEAREPCLVPLGPPPHQ